MLDAEKTPDEAPVPVVNGVVTIEDVEPIERTPDEVELITTMVEDDTPVLRGTEVTPVPVGLTTTIDEVPLPYGELSVLVEET